MAGYNLSTSLSPKALPWFCSAGHPFVGGKGLRAAAAHTLLARAGFQFRPISAKCLIGESRHPGSIRGATRYRGQRSRRLGPGGEANATRKSNVLGSFSNGRIVNIGGGLLSGSMPLMGLEWRI